MVSPIIAVTKDDGSVWYQVGYYAFYYHYPYLVTKGRPVPISRMYGSTNLGAIVEFTRDYYQLAGSVPIEPLPIPHSELARFPTYYNQVIRWRYSDKFLRELKVSAGLHIALTYLHTGAFEKLLEYPDFYGVSALQGITEDDWKSMLRRKVNIEQMIPRNVYGANYPS